MIAEIFKRNELLAWFGMNYFMLFIGAFLASQFDFRQFNNINVWIKPMKFALAAGIFTWTMAWFLYYLPVSRSIFIINLIIVVSMNIELIAIFMQAGRGIGSHFNVHSGWFNSMVFSVMGIAITINTFAIAYVAWLFFVSPVNLPEAYLWGIRLGLVMFVLFSFEGFVMGSLLKHTVGAADGGKGIPFLNWSVNAGDLRVAHFIGIHALQVVPFVGFLVSLWEVNLLWSILFSAIYFVVSLGTFIQAMMGKPLFRW